MWLLDDNYVRFCTNIIQTNCVGIPMGTNCAPLVADLFRFCYERDFMLSLSDDSQAAELILLKHLTQPLDIWTNF